MLWLLSYGLKPFGLYRHWRGLGLHEVGYKAGDIHIRPPSLPSTPRRVPSGHGRKSSISYLHGPIVRPMSNRPNTQGPLNTGLSHQVVVVDEDVVAHAHLGDNDLGTRPGMSAGVLELERVKLEEERLSNKARISLRESWIRASPDSRTISIGRTVRL